MELRFPTYGLNVGIPADKQPAGTSRDLDNVRPYYNGVATGGQRPPLNKWGNGDQIGGAEQPVVDMCSVTVVT